MTISVTHIVRQYLPSVGGMEEVVRNIALHQLHSSNHTTRIITLNRLFRHDQKNVAAPCLPAREIIDGIEVIRLPYFGSSRYPLCPGLLRPSILRALSNSDVIHVHGVDFFYDFLAVIQWLHQRPLVLSTHGGFFHTRFASHAKHVYFNTITRFSARAYQRVVATSENDATVFRKIINDDKLEVIENGVDVKKYAHQSSPSLTPTLIYFGRWSSNKGLLEVLTLFSQLHSAAPEWRLIIAGREYDHTKEELLEYARALGIAANLELIANPTDDEIRQAIGKASYFICLSHHEGFGIAPIEAMSAGLTPILSDIPPFRRLCEKAQQGLLIEKSDQKKIIDQLIQLHNQGEVPYQKRRAAASAFSLHYAWPAVADKYLALYEKLGTT
jgi:alpha-1,3-mannosyltransferase